MSYIGAGADIGPEGGILSPSWRQYAREGAPEQLVEQTEVYDLGSYVEGSGLKYDPRQRLNIQGGDAWLQAAQTRYGTDLGAVDGGSKKLMMVGLLGLAALVLYKSGFIKNPRRKRHTVVVVSKKGEEVKIGFAKRADAEWAAKDIRSLRDPSVARVVIR